MRYPQECKNIIDVTKPPYNADSTGKEDCTQALIQAFDDVLKDYVTELEKTRKKLYELSDGLKYDVHIGRESGRVWDGVMTVTFPEFIPEAKIIYFPKGVYRISDTVTYSMKNINTYQWADYKCELCRNIHILGEDKENTVISLDDNAKGFDKLKPVISFNTASKIYDEKESTNCAMQNTVKDITIDCGQGNDKAIGIYYISSNLGRIENVDIISDGGHCGIYFDCGSEGVFRNITIRGFDYGFDSVYTSPVVMENIDVSGNKIAGMTAMDAAVIARNFHSGDIISFNLRPGTCGRYYFYDSSITYNGDETGNTIIRKCENPLLEYKPFPEKRIKNYDTDYVIVDDFGAVGDGVTDCTRAIQAAMNSGKSIILFGSGPYLISNTIKIPKSVKVIDFMYGNLAVGIDLITGEAEAAFDICEESDDVLFIENIFAHEQMFGYFRCFKHSAKRDVVLSDIYTPFSAMYFNTIGGSNVYIDNCFMTSGSYSQSAWLRRGYKPVFSKVLPYEFHNQKVYAKNLNIERGDIELLNDNSEVYIDGYKTEGPGCALKSINGGKTQINICNNGIWHNTVEENSLFDISKSEIELSAILPFYIFPDKREYLTALNIDGEKTNLLDIGEYIKYDYRMIKYYRNKTK